MLQAVRSEIGERVFFSVHACGDEITLAGSVGDVAALSRCVHFHFAGKFGKSFFLSGNVNDLP